MWSGRALQEETSMRLSSTVGRQGAALRDQAKFITRALISGRLLRRFRRRTLQMLRRAGRGALTAYREAVMIWAIAAWRAPWR